MELYGLNGAIAVVTLEILEASKLEKVAEESLESNIQEFSGKYLVGHKALVDEIASCQHWREHCH